MRLNELDPRWSVTEDGRHGMGITFWCPHCVGNPNGTHLGVWFANPIDGGPAAPDLHPHDRNALTHPDDPRWIRGGVTFDTLTLSPSVDVSRAGHWHGFIINGEVR